MVWLERKGPRHFCPLPDGPEVGEAGTGSRWQCDVCDRIWVLSAPGAVPIWVQESRLR